MIATPPHLQAARGPVWSVRLACSCHRDNMIAKGGAARVSPMMVNRARGDNQSTLTAVTTPRKSKLDAGFDQQGEGFGLGLALHVRKDARQHD